MLHKKRTFPDFVDKAFSKRQCRTKHAIFHLELVEKSLLESFYNHRFFETIRYSPRYRFNSFFINGNDRHCPEVRIFEI